MAAATPPRALVVGTGFGCRIHIPALRAAGFEIAGLVGADPERTARRASANGVPRAFTDLDDAITQTGAAAVTIATTPHTHGPLTLTAIARGCHVICEKPFARDLAEARRMIAAAKAANVVNLVGHEFRWLPERALIGRAIADGLIGEPRLLTLTNYIPLVADPEAKMPRWWFDIESGGGWLGASGSHIVDQARTWLGEITSLNAVLPIVSDRKNVAEDTYTLRLRFANGAEGVVQQTAGAWGPSASMARVAGTHGTLWIDQGAVWIADRAGARKIEYGPEYDLPVLQEQSDDPRKRFSAFEFGPYARLCDAFKTCIEGKPYDGPAPLPTFADGVAGMAVLDAIRTSAGRDGALINL